MRTAVAALNMAALRVNIGSFLHLDRLCTGATLHRSLQACLRCDKFALIWREPPQSYVGHRIGIGDAALTLSKARCALRGRSFHRPT
jgi:hypothetical protein